MYAAANDILGNVPKVTPSSKVIGDLALALVGLGADPADVRREPRRLRHPRRRSSASCTASSATRRAAGRSRSAPRRSRAGTGPLPPRSCPRTDRRGLAASSADRRHTLNRLLFPGPTKEFEAAHTTYGDVSILPTLEYLYGLRVGEEHTIDLDEGRRLLLGLEAIGEPDERGYRTVMCRMNGQLRPIPVRDLSITSDAAGAEKADPANPDHVAAPYQGAVTIAVAEGDQVEAGATLATIEAMKMEASITAPRAGKVARLGFTGTRPVEGGDLVLELE